MEMPNTSTGRRDGRHGWMAEMGIRCASHAAENVSLNIFYLHGPHHENLPLGKRREEWLDSVSLAAEEYIPRNGEKLTD